MLSTPRSVVVDTGPMVALFDTNDPDHQAASDYFRSTTAIHISTPASLTEAMYLLDFSIVGQTNLLAWIKRGGMRLEQITNADIDRVATLMRKYADRPMDFADGLIVAICERLGIPHIATFDSDFDIYRINGRSQFVNVLR